MMSQNIPGPNKWLTKLSTDVETVAKAAPAAPTALTKQNATFGLLSFDSFALATCPESDATLRSSLRGDWAYPHSTQIVR